MALHLVRFQHQDQPRWGLLEGTRITPLDLPCTTTAALIEQGHEAIRAAAGDGAELALEDTALLSPITNEAKVLCQGANYRQHMIDSGMNPDDKSFNMFFTKSSGSITGPGGEIVKPAHVQLLDYEVELTLVLGKKTDGPVDVTAANLHEFVAGFCIGNDVSARDVQIPQMQFHKGKSYRTFCPLGPVLCLLDKSEMHYLDEMQLSLTVNGETRQQDSTANLVFKPAETLTEYSQIHDFAPGDVLMTGTPAGCALGLPSPAVTKVAALLPESKKWQLFIKSQKRRQQYLQAGDVVEATITSRDQTLDLGKQRHTIKDGV
ncbi:MAG: fumarylacetoacetate hydrolase family protein [Alloalcanivorax venustensis]|uniref:fumarylacetoacetate hydrolase family protein n=1 Tax=Gammaproteobacteria TaxID=1236 RepID=UPI003296EFC6